MIKDAEKVRFVVNIGITFSNDAGENNECKYLQNNRRKRSMLTFPRESPF